MDALFFLQCMLDALVVSVHAGYLVPEKIGFWRNMPMPYNSWITTRREGGQGVQKITAYLGPPRQDQQAMFFPCCSGAEQRTVGATSDLQQQS